MLIEHTKADGLHFANCLDAQADRITVKDSGDDGLAFVHYADGPEHTGGIATGIRVEGSAARGIAVVGQSQVVIRDFAIDWTSSSGLYCAQEPSFDTRTPRDIVFERGVIRHAGRWRPTEPVAEKPSSLVGNDRADGNDFGIEMDSAEDITFSNIQVIDPATRGVSLYRGTRHRAWTNRGQPT